MGNPLKLNQAGSMSKGINENQPDFQMDLQLTDNTVNVTSGIVEGIGPRYGFAPIPGHMDQEAVASGQFAGLMRYELGQSLSLECNRVGIYAIYPLDLNGPNNSINTADTYYLYIVSYTLPDSPTITYYDVLVGSINDSGFIEQSPYIYSGLPYSGIDLANQLSLDAASGAANLQGDLGTELLTFSTYTTSTSVFYQKQAYLTNLLQSISGNPYIGSACVSVTGAEVPMNWFFGSCIDTPTSTSTALLNLSRYYNSSQTLGVFLGYSPSMNYANVQNTNRQISMYYLQSNFAPPASAFLDYVFNYVSDLYSPSYTETASQVSVNAVTASPTAYSGAGYSSATGALIYDSAMTCNSSFSAVLIAAQYPVIMLFQDWYRGNKGSLTQYVDPTNYATSPPQIAQNASIILGGANTGQLRANTLYEITLSIFNKRLNHETNVCPNTLQFTVDGNDYNSIVLGTPLGETFAQIVLNASYVSLIPFPGFGSVAYGEGSPALHLNYLEYRFYYRQVGSQYWLPALFVDAAKYWFYPHYHTSVGIPNSGALTMCTAPIGGVTGGVPGGLEDYSPLPQDNYTCALMFKNRAFWFSNKALIFSLTNNIFAYPGRNIATCPTGTFKGAIVQAYYGQAIQNSRLVIFSTEGTYVGQFTGNILTEQVIISGTSGATVQPIDGSDFSINAWTSVTAFSYRSAVVAEGLLYFWGPNGIFLDDGVNPIQRISVPLEPELFNAYDPSQTDAIHCEYNDTTKEIWWFYQPLGGDATYPTHGICYNKLKNTWLIGGFEGAIDAVQSMHVENEEATAGTRFVVFSRQSPSSTIQRAYYFDQNNLASDIFPGKELMVKAIATPVGQPNQRTLTLAAGYSTGAIVAGDLIALQQCAAYGTSLTSPSDFIAKVIAYTAGSVTIALPNGATLDGTASISTNSQYFPIWHAAGTNGVITGRGINAFDYNIDTKFWIPNGMSYWALWNYLHLVYKLYDLLPIDVPLTQTLNYQTPVSGSVGADTLTLINNSANNCQIFHPLAPGNLSFEGQGIKLTFSGIQLAGSWVLQFLEAMSNIKDGMNLFIFEG